MKYKEKMIKDLTAIVSAIEILATTLQEALYSGDGAGLSEASLVSTSSPATRLSTARANVVSKSAHATAENAIFCYVLGCAGCRRLSNMFGHHIYKIGTSNDPDFSKRLHELQGDGYGALVQDGTRFVKEPGFDKWVSLAIATSGQPGNAAIKVLPRAIKVTLPQTMTSRTFDARLRKALTPRALHLRNDPGKPGRYTSYIEDGDEDHPRISRATEFYEFSPRNKDDGDMLIQAIEAILQGQHKPKK